MADPTPLQAQGYALQQQYRATEEAIRGNTRLTVQSREDDIRRLHADTQARLDELRAQQDGQKEARISELKVRLLTRSPLEGTDPSLTISYRDAYERASTIADDDEALALMRQATLTRDVPLERAVLSRAYDARWPDVVNAYTAEHRLYETEADELWTLTTPAGFDQFVQDSFANGMAFNLAAPLPVAGVDLPVAPAPRRGR
jgi:hypothetical protein